MNRRVVRDRNLDQKSAVKLFDEDPQPRVLGRFPSQVTVAEARLIKGLSRVPFDRLSSIRIEVRRAIGLPALTTATRVIARLMDTEMQQVGDCSPSSFSSSDSEATSPMFNLNANWRGKRPETVDYMKYCMIPNHR